MPIYAEDSRFVCCKIRQIRLQETGSTFFDYVEQLRFDKAVLLLKHSNTPIAQIAEECGFNSINSFYKAFKRKSTLTPAVVRQQMREN